MPKVVDHGGRRHELADATWRAIVKYGLDGTTTRVIARESGYSAGVLAHYFESKDDLLLEALRISHEGLDERLQAAISDKHGLDALRAFCIEVLPTSDLAARETHLEMSMWSRALVNDELRGVQRRESARWGRVMEGLIRDAQHAGEMVDLDPRTIAVTLSALIDGLSIYGLLYPDRFGRGEIIALLDNHLGTLALPPAQSDGKKVRRAGRAPH
jgi:AcrR family transcriptional regulator